MDHGCVVYVNGLVFMFVNNTYFIDSIGVDIVFYNNFVICVYMCTIVVVYVFILVYTHLLSQPPNVTMFFLCL